MRFLFLMLNLADDILGMEIFRAFNIGVTTYFKVRSKLLVKKFSRAGDEIMRGGGSFQSKQLPLFKR